MARNVMTNAEMQAEINAGRRVLYKGRILRTLSELPNDAQILIDFPLYGYNKFEGNARAILGYEITGNLTNGVVPQWNDTDKKWELNTVSGGSGTPPGSNKQLIFNNNGAYGAITGYEYDPAASWTLKGSPTAGKTGLLLWDSGTPPTEIGGSYLYPTLLQLHTEDLASYGIAYTTNESPSTMIANYPASGGLWFDTFYNGTFGSNGFLPYGGLAFYSGGSGSFGGIYQHANDVFAIGIVQDTINVGVNSNRIIFRTNGVTSYVPSTALSDANVPTNHLHFFIDEPTDTLRVKWKESGGTVLSSIVITSASGLTGTGSLVFANTPTITTPTISGALTQGGAINIGTTSTDGVVLQNTTAAAAGAQQYSSRMRFRGSGWKTNATAGAQNVDLTLELQPVQGTTAPSGNLVFATSINGGAYSNTAILASNLTTLSHPAFGRDSSVGAIGFGLIDVSTNSFRTGMRTSSDDLFFTHNATSYFRMANGSGFRMRNDMLFGWSADANLNLQDAIMRRVAAASIAFGNVDAASPVAQTLSVQNVVAGTSDAAGANWTFAGSRGTGTGAGGSIIFQTAPAGSTGSSQNALATALTINSAGQVLLKTGSSTSLSLADANGTGYGLYFAGDNTITLRAGGPLFSFINNSNNGAFNITAAGLLGWTPATDTTTNPDVILGRVAAGNLRMGAADAASPVAQTLSVQNVAAGTSNTAGADWTFLGSRGTGTGAGGSLIFRTAPAGSTGSSQNSSVTRLTIPSTGGIVIEPSAGAAPTASGTIAYDSTTNVVKAGVNGATVDLSTFSVSAYSMAAPGVSQVLLRLVFDRAVNIPAQSDGTNAYVKAGVAATAQTDFTVKKNGTTFATLRFAAAGTQATWQSATSTDFAAGDVLTLVAPASPDATLADIGFTITVKMK